MLRGGARPRIAVVQRRKDNGWVLPKGKLKWKESAISAARREACEETGYHVAVREFLGVVSAAGRSSSIFGGCRRRANRDDDEGHQGAGMAAAILGDPAAVGAARAGLSATG